MIKKIVSSKDLNLGNGILVVPSDIGTDFHFDTFNSGISTIRMWIPLSDIENFPLVVGDARSIFEDSVACEGGLQCSTFQHRVLQKRFDEVSWYQQKKMTPTDAIFWDTSTVPHGSVNIRPNTCTKKRVALVVVFDVEDV